MGMGFRLMVTLLQSDWLWAVGILFLLLLMWWYGAWYGVYLVVVFVASL